MPSVENGCSPSTTYEWKKVKIQPPARAHRAQPPKASKSSVRRRFIGRTLSELRTATSLVVRYRGGAETWWELSWGGVTKRFPGHVALDDVLLCMFQHGPGCAGHREQRIGDWGEPEPGDDD